MPRLLLPRLLQGCSFVLAALTMLSPTLAANNGATATPTPTVDNFVPVALAVESAWPESKTILRGRDARQQLIVTATDAAGQRRDYTDRIKFTTEPANLVAVDEAGLVRPLADGKVKVRATAEKEKLSAGAELSVEHFTVDTAVNFPNQIVPIFTKHGCNGGGCHGKSGGQNGFKLSLLGFEPTEDYEHLVKEARGRRLFPAAPERSLLLEKGIGSAPHGGGRIERDSYEYRLLLRWMAQGMPYGNKTDPTVVRISVYPDARTMPRQGRQQLITLAHYSDGSIEDVTPLAKYEPNDTELAEVGATGLVKTLDLAGDVAIMARYQGAVSVFRATVPLGVKVDKLPPAKNFIDQLVFKKLQTLGMPPSDVADDATFLRRVSIDIAGRLPTSAEAEQFLADAGADKRDRLIDRLLASGDYADYFANKWNSVLRNRRRQPSYIRGNYNFHEWIRDALYTNLPYDEFTRGILAASGESGEHPPVAWYREVNNVEQQVEDSAQLFLGLRIQCARCHHHPFEKWSQRDYYSYGAFFSTVGKKPGVGIDEQNIYHKRGRAAMTNPKTGESVRPTGLGSKSLDLPAERDPRQALVDWMAEPQNEFFARALVNRYWKHFFGRALVEPEDDMRVTNPASNPELLDALAKHFVDHKFDLKDLVRTLCQSTAYQLSAIPNEHNGRDKQNFSRHYPQRLAAEVLLDAVDSVTVAPTSFAGLPAGTRAVQLPDSGTKHYFLTVFGRPEMSSACECERSSDANLAQSLHLLNSADVQQKLSGGSGRAAQLAKDDKQPEDQKVRGIYLSVFARAPEAAETAAAVEYIGKAKVKQQAYEDILWALVNTKEFLFNH